MIVTENISYQKCDKTHLADIMKIQRDALLIMTDKTLLRENSEDKLALCLLEPHYTLGAFYEDKLIAFAILYVGGETEENLGLSLEDIDHVANDVVNLKLIIVSKEFRGNKLQISLVRKLEELAIEKRFYYICATIATNNEHSTKNFEKLGYHFEKQEIKYEGFMRNLYRKVLIPKTSNLGKLFLAISHKEQN